MNIIKLPKITDTRGSLSYLESGKHVPFIISTIKLLTVQNKTEKYFFLNNNDSEFALIPLCGGFKLAEKDAEGEYIVNEPDKGIHISGKNFFVFDFTENTVILILCSKPDFNVRLEL